MKITRGDMFSTSIYSTAYSVILFLRPEIQPLYLEGHVLSCACMRVAVGVHVLMCVVSAGVCLCARKCVCVCVCVCVCAYEHYKNRMFTTYFQDGIDN